jgi:excisionase family DNA binding protein
MSELIRTGTAAKILGTSRQHVVDLCTRGSLRCHGTGVHRRLDRREVEALVDRARTRDDRQSAWLHLAVAGRVARDPRSAIEKARANLRTMRSAHRGRNPWLDRWERLFDAGPEAVVGALVANTPESVELRQNSPFAGVLTDRERRLALNAFRSIDHADRP